MNWETMKSGVRKRGSWYIRDYPTGWYRWTATPGVMFGPFKTFEKAAEGAK